MTHTLFSLQFHTFIFIYHVLMNNDYSQLCIAAIFKDKRKIVEKLKNMKTSLLLATSNDINAIFLRQNFLSYQSIYQ